MDANKVLTGSDGNVWVNGKLLAQVQSIELKVAGKFEDMDFIGDNTTYSRFTGYNGDGTLKMKKIDSTVLNLVGKAYQKGVMPEIKIITKLTDKNTNKSERVAVSGIKITEFYLAKFDSKTPIDDELPLKFSKYEILETIN